MLVNMKPSCLLKDIICFVSDLTTLKRRLSKQSYVV